MNYTGSKQKLLDFIEETIESVAGRFREKNYKVIANDIQYYSYLTPSP